MYYIASVVVIKQVQILSVIKVFFFCQTTRLLSPPILSRDQSLKIEKYQMFNGPFVLEKSGVQIKITLDTHIIWRQQK